jgi:Ca2+-binding RTX toxin-like protein
MATYSFKAYRKSLFVPDDNGQLTAAFAHSQNGGKFNVAAAAPAIMAVTDDDTILQDSINNGGQTIDLSSQVLSAGFETLPAGRVVRSLARETVFNETTGQTGIAYHVHVYDGTSPNSAGTPSDYFLVFSIPVNAGDKLTFTASATQDVGDVAYASISDVNQAPVITTAATPLAYVENETRVLDAGITITDADAGDVVKGVTVKFTGGYVAAEDRLVFTKSAAFGDIEGSFAPATATLVLYSKTGTATTAQYEAALRSVAYRNSSENPTVADRTITISAIDGEVAGTTTRTIQVSRVNDAPRASGALETATGEEDAVLSGQLLAGSDADGDALTFVLGAAPKNGTLLLNSNGSWNWTPVDDFNGLDSFTYRVSDGTATSELKTVNLSVRPDTGVGSPNAYDWKYEGLYFSKAGSLNAGFQEKIGSSVYLEFGGNASLQYDIGFGLVISASFEKPDFDVEYNIDVAENLSQATDDDGAFLTAPNVKPYVETKNWTQGTVELSTNGVNPSEAKFAVDLVGKIDARLDLGFNIGGGISIDFGEIDLGFLGTIDLGEINESFNERFDSTIFDVNQSGSLRVLSLDASQLTKTVEFSSGGNKVGEIVAGLPDAIDVSTTTLIADNDRFGNLSVSGRSDNKIIDATLDLDSIVATVLGLPSFAFGGSVGADIGPFDASLSYDIISAALKGGIGLEQKHTFTAGDVDVTMTSSFGPEAATNGQTVVSEIVTGKLGETLTFVTPQGEGTFTVSASYVLDGVITTETGLYGDTSFIYSLLGGGFSAGIDIDFGIARLNESLSEAFGPLVSGQADIASGYFGTLFTQTQSVNVTVLTELYTLTYENFYIGDARNDVFTMTRRQVIANGETGNDRITGNALDNIIDGGADNDVLLGLGGNDRIKGGTGMDTLDGGVGDDDLDGGAGNDLLISGTGRNTLNGGDDYDRVSYQGATAGVVASLTAGTAQWGATAAAAAARTDAASAAASGPTDGAIDTLVNIEAVDGTEFADEIEGDAKDNVIRSFAGIDKLWGRAGDDDMDGGSDKDELYGDGGDDVLVGGSEADLIDGGADRDTASYRTALGGVTASLTTRAGTVGDAAGDRFVSIENFEGSLHNDKFDGDAGSNLLSGLAGNDLLFGAGGDDILMGGAGADAMKGGTGFDIASYRNSTSAVGASLQAGGTVGDGAGDTFVDIEAIEGGDFGDTLSGNTGHNKVYGLGGDDTLFGGTGDDLVLGDVGADRLFGESGNDRLDGGEGDDFIDGGTGVDWMFGKAGRDTLIAGTGNDYIDGGADADVLTGSGGYDFFIFLSAEHIGTSGGAHDVITDFQQGVDKIDLSAIYNGKAFGGLTFGTSIDSAPAANGLVAFFDGSRTWIQGDVDGNGTADFALELSGNYKLKLNDFITSQAGWNSYHASISTPAPNYAQLHSADLVMM